MKKTLISLIAMLLPVLAFAGKVSEEQALLRAQQFLASHGGRAVMQGKTFHRAISRHQSPSVAAAVPYYVFNAEQQGYVIVSADDRTVSVLGYSLDGTLDLDSLPAHVQAWLDGYAAQLQWLQSHPQASAARRVQAVPAISPLLGKTKWNQDEPYNLFCPKLNGELCVTGCVATAMAQVMYYHQWPEATTKKIPAYTSSTNGFAVKAVAAGTAISWGNMLPSYNDGSATTTQREAVARLMSICGTSLEMDYDIAYNGGSAANTGDVAYALYEYFDYDASTKCLSRSDYKLEEWNSLIYSELVAGRPVVYSGSSSGGGHAFVIDGYDSDDYFHVNWGWGGKSNGYFLLSILDPDSNDGIGASSSTDGYSTSQQAVVGIRKNTGVVPEQLVALTTSTISIANSSVTRVSTNSNFNFKVTTDFRNKLDDEYTFNFGFGLFDAEGNFQKLASNPYTVTLGVGWGYSPQDWQLSFGANMPNGTYVIKPVSRESGTDTWHPNFGSEQNYIIATISGKNLTMEVFSPRIDVELSLMSKTESPRANRKCVMECSITNNGTDFNDQLFFLVDGSVVGGRHYDIAAGETGSLEFYFVPQAAGTKTVEVAREEYNWSSGQWEYIPYTSCQVVVGDAPAADLGIVFSATDAVSDVVFTADVEMSATLTNNVSDEYDDDISIDIWQRVGSKYYYIDTKTVAVLVPGNETVTVTFTINDLDDGTYNMWSCYKGQDGEWKDEGYYSFTVKKTELATSQVTYTLSEGWNWISTSLADVSQRESLVFIGDIESVTTRLLGQTTELIFDPELGFVGDLGVLDAAAGYKLKVTADASMTKEGAAVSTITPIELKRGWNWLGYLPTVPLTVSTALENLHPTVGDRMLSQDSFAEFDGTAWSGDFVMLPGEGFMYKAATNVQLVYSSSTTPATVRAGQLTSSAEESLPWQYDIHRYPDVMTIVAQLYADGSTTGRERYAVGAFCGGECRGVARMVGDNLFITVHGTFDNSESICFLALDKMTGDVLPIDEELDFRGECLGSLSSPMPLNIVGQTTDIVGTETKADVKAHVFGLDGRESRQLRKGVNILVGPDGSRRTVISMKDEK